MCERLLELRSAVSRFAASFDASSLSAADASGVLAEAAAIEAMAAAVKGLAALRVAEAGVWKEAGDRSAASHLARSTGTSVTQASEVLETARRLGALPEVDAAARAGSLSASQVSAVAGAAAVDPWAEARLVALAGSASLGELREECLRTRAAARPDGEARRRAIHEGRFLRSWTDAEGAWNLRMRDNPEVGAAILAALAPLCDRIFRAARAEGRSDSSEAYAADALAELARGGGATTKRSGTKVIVRVDLEALLRGYVMSGEVCELAASGRWRSRRSGTCWTPPTRSWPRW